MKRRWFFPIALACALPASGFEYRLGHGTNTLVLEAQEVLPEESLLMATRLELHGQAQQDLWLLATADIQFHGDAQDDLRLATRSAILDGTARKNLIAYANGLHLTTNSVVHGEALLLGANVICEGRVNGPAFVLAKSITLGGHWGGNVRIQANEIRVVPGTQIAGDLIYSAAKPLVYDPSVTIGGNVVERDLPVPTASWADRLTLHGYLFLAALLAGMPFVGFFPLYTGVAVRNLRVAPLRALMVGGLTLLLGPFLFVFLLVSAIGIPLALLLGALYAALAYLGHIVVALWIGHLLLRRDGPQSFARVLTTLAAGLFVIYFLSALPGAASFLLLLAVLPGLGALLMALRQRPIWAVPTTAPAVPTPPPLKPDDPTDSPPNPP